MNSVWKDFTLLLVMTFFVMVVWMLPHLNPPAQEDNTEPPGNLIVHIVWPPGDTDVDLWLSAPGDGVPVGYSNKNGRVWNLLRDDTGTAGDASGLNFENAYTRGIPPGEYIFNLSCYRCAVTPVPVVIEIKVKSPDGDKNAKPLLTVNAELSFHGEEITAVRFKLDREHNIVFGSLNHFFEPLRQGSAGAVGRPGGGIEDR